MSENINNRQLALQMATEIVKAQCGAAMMAYYDVMELANHMYHFLENEAYKGGDK
jgi:hypothetical protein